MRARATSLVLVNWRGVFYQRYQLDPRVTALEGANGAGKTTVMIAAYLVLLPDLSRLKFTNVGESGATGGDRGIYGRLGQQGGPSYAVIEFRTARGERLLAGVQLVRRTEPTIDLKTFLVTDLPASAGLQDVLLHKVGALDQVPELPQLRDAVAAAAGRLVTFGSAKDYFGALFDHGITPLRLAVEEERTKLNEMLRTSMTGGISRTLTRDLRSFLLRRESGLGDTLANMRANLEACRRTRTEVSAAAGLQAEISGVYEAGEQMFAAALHATRERADEARRAVDQARVLSEAARGVEHAAREVFEAVERAMQTVGGRLDEARERRQAAEREHERLGRAHAVVERRDGLRAREAVARRELEVRKAEEDAARQAREQARDAHGRAQDAHRRAARGLADLQEGLADLYRRAEAHQQVTARLAAVRQHAAEPLDELGLDGAHAAVRDERAALDEEAPAVDNQIRTAERRRAEHAAALAALETVAGAIELEEPPREQAQRALARLTELRFLAGRRAELDQQLTEAHGRSAAQTRVRAAAAAAGLEVGPEGGAATVTAALREAADAREAAERAAQDHRRAQEAAQRVRSGAEECLERLSRRALAWAEVVALVARLGEPVAQEADLDALEVALRDQRDGLLPVIVDAEARRDRALDEARELERAGGSFPADLLRIRDELGGELLAARFDDVAPEEAGPLQAALGPLTAAVVVEDALDAAGRLAGGSPGARHGVARDLGPWPRRDRRRGGGGRRRGGRGVRRGEGVAGSRAPHAGPSCAGAAGARAPSRGGGCRGGAHAGARRAPPRGGAGRSRARAPPAGGRAVGGRSGAGDRV